MTHDVETLRLWIRVVTFIAACCTTTVPIIYSFSPWWRSRLGQLFMLQACAFAAAMDLTCLFMVWQPKNIVLIFWVDAFFLSAIAISTLALAILILTINFPRQKGRHHREARK